MKSLRRPHSQRSIASSVIFLAAHALPALAEESVSFPVQPGESLPQAVHRIHPCPMQSMGDAYSRVVEANPERVDANGEFVLANPMLVVPRSFADEATACMNPHPTPSAAPATAAAPAVMATPPAETRTAAPESRESAPESTNVLKLGSFAEYCKMGFNDFAGDAISINSNIEYGATLELDHWLSRTAFVGATFRYTHSTTDTSNANWNFVESSTHYESASLTGGYQFSPDFLFRAYAGAKQIIHVSLPLPSSQYPIPPVQINLDPYWVPEVKLEGQYTFYRARSMDFSARAGFISDLPTRGTTLVSFGPEVGLGAEFELVSHLSVGIGGSLQYVRQSFSDGTYGRTNYGVDGDLGFHF